MAASSAAPTSGELAVDEDAVGGAGGGLLRPVQRQPVRGVQPGPPSGQQQVREVAVEQHLCVQPEQPGSLL